MTGQAKKWFFNLIESQKKKQTTQVQTGEINRKHKCPEKERLFISSEAHSSPSLSDTHGHVHKSPILLGLTKIPFQNKQPSKGSEHPEASPTLNVRGPSLVHRELLPLGPPGTSGWAVRVWSRGNAPSFDLEPSYVGGLFFFLFCFFIYLLFDNRRSQTDLSPHVTWECDTHSDRHIKSPEPLEMLPQSQQMRD